MKQYKNNGGRFVNDVLGSIKQRRYSLNHGRYRSWEDCYNAFRSVYNKGFSMNDTEFLALHLAGYLASWGMYRGSSDLLREYSYLVHKDLIPLLYNSKYLSLFDIDENNFEQNLQLIESAYSEIEVFYNALICNNKQFKASETLVTKIMLGVYGCIPAYDRFLREGLKYYEIQKSGKNKFGALSEWLNNNPDFVSDIIAYGKASFNNYPFMKLVDMCFWELGWRLIEKNNKEVVK